MKTLANLGLLSMTKLIAAGTLAAAAVAAAGCGANPLDVDAVPPVSGAGEETAALTGITVLPPVIINPPVIACGIHLAALPGRYDFDAGSTSGWEVSGLFDGDTATRVLQIGPAPATFVDYEDAGGSASNTDGRGAAFVLGAISGLPATNNGWWREDFISPDLSHSNSWQRGGTTYAVRDDITFDGPALKAQVVLEVHKCDGSDAFRRQVDASANAVFCTVARDGSWTNCSSTVSMTGVAYVKRVHIRVFGQSGYGYEGGVYVDQVRSN